MVDPPSPEELQELYAKSLERLVMDIKRGRYLIISMNHERKENRASGRTKNSLVEITPTGEYVLNLVFRDNDKKTGR